MSAVGLNRTVLQASLTRMQQRLRDEPNQLHREFKPAFSEWGSKWQRGVHSRFENGDLHSRSGRLKGGVTARPSGETLGTLRLDMSVDGSLAYARAQQFGGVIRPKNGKFLTIPTAFNKTASGVPDFPSARALISAHPDQTFFAPGRKGGLFLFLKNPTKKAVVARTRKFSDLRAGGVEKGAAVPMFSLVKEVDLPGPNSVKHKRASRLGFFETWNEQRTARAADLVRIALRGRS